MPIVHNSFSFKNFQNDKKLSNIHTITFFSKNPIQFLKHSLALINRRIERHRMASSDELIHFLLFGKFFYVILLNNLHKIFTQTVCARIASQNSSQIFLIGFIDSFDQILLKTFKKPQKSFIFS